MSAPIKWLLMNAEWIIKCELYSELVISAICFVINVYFAIRFAQISTFDPSLRFVMVVAHIIKANLSIFHSTLQMLPENLYSLKDGQYLGASIFYFLQFWIQVCVFLVGTEYTIIIVERKMAVYYFDKSETVDNCAVGKKVIFVSTGVTMLGILLKAIFILLFYSNVPIQERLENAFMIERSPGSLIFLHLAAVVTCVYGFYEFVHLNRYVRQRCYDGSTLNERYQIKQTGIVLEVLKPITLAYFTCVLMTLFGVSFTLHSYYVLGYGLKSTRYVLFNYTEYVSVAFYNLFSTLYMIYFFKPLRRQMYKDFGCFCRKQLMSQNSVEPNKIDWAKEREVHFDYLYKSWQVD